MSLIEIVFALAAIGVAGYIAWQLRVQSRVSEQRALDAAARHRELLQTLDALRGELEAGERRQIQRNSEQIGAALGELIADFNDKIGTQLNTHLATLTALGERGVELAAKHRQEQMEAMHHARRLADRIDAGAESFAALVADNGELLALAGQVRDTLSLLGPRQNALDGEILRQAESVAAMAEALQALRAGFEQAAENLLQQTRRSLDASAQRQAQASSSLQKELNDTLARSIAGVQKQLTAMAPAKVPAFR